uniref:Uncharacterized protein n=1 Tax=Arundo donax TaxID=35708 RepID=A0A0A9DYK3_ARUDO
MLSASLIIRASSASDPGICLMLCLRRRAWCVADDTAFSCRWISIGIWAK